MLTVLGGCQDRSPGYQYVLGTFCHATTHDDLDVEIPSYWMGKTQLSGPSPFLLNQTVSPLTTFKMQYHSY